MSNYLPDFQKSILFNYSQADEMTENKAIGFLIDSINYHDDHPNEQIRIASWLVRITLKQFLNAKWLLEMECKKELLNAR